MKIYICNTTGSIYWLNGSALMFAPMVDGVFNPGTDGSEVDMAFVSTDSRKHMPLFKLFKKIYQLLNNK